MKLSLLSTSARKDIVGCTFAQRASSGYHEESPVLFSHLQRTESRSMNCIIFMHKVDMGYHLPYHQCQVAHIHV